MFRIHLSACVKPSPIHFPHRPYFRFPLSRLPSKNSTARALLRPLPSPLRPPPCHFFHIPTALQPPLIFTALLLALWVYKCAMLVLFQNRIIYMPSMPPFARSERIAEYAAACRPVTWRQERIRTKDGETLAVAVGEIAGVSRCEEAEGVGERKRVVIIYFQGYVFLLGFIPVLFGKRYSPSQKPKNHAETVPLSRPASLGSPLSSNSSTTRLLTPPHRQRHSQFTPFLHSPTGATGPQPVALRNRA